MLRKVAKETTTTGLWLKLDSLYMTKSVTDRLLLKSKLHDLKLEEGKSLKSHLGEFDSIVMDLHNIDVKLDDEELVIRLLCSLPPDYKHFRETVLYGRDELSLEDVRSALLQRELIENQLTRKDDLVHGGEGLVARGRPKERNNSGGRTDTSKSRSKSRFKNVVWHACRKKGHIRKFCPKKGKKNKGKGVTSTSNQDDSAAVAHSDSDDSILLAVESNIRT